jgi:hypothetical protein
VTPGDRSAAAGRAPPSRSAGPDVRAVVVADGNGFGGAQVYARSLVAHAPPG